MSHRSPLAPMLRQRPETPATQQSKYQTIEAITKKKKKKMGDEYLREQDLHGRWRKKAGSGRGVEPETKAEGGAGLGEGEERGG
jgi:hypothetical protein